MEYLSSVTPKNTCKLLGVHFRTLHNWDAKGYITSIRTPGNKRLYNVKKYMEDYGIELKEVIKKRKICYCRVSSVGQRDDLQRQIEYMKDLYPSYEIMYDIGSGLNFKRKNLKKIINLAIANQIDEIVIAYKDRLCRFGYDLI